MSSLAGLSASVTRILFLSGFPKELKTKDIQSAFADWEGGNGGFKIKWLDDTSLLIVFQDPSVAKRAYLQTLAYPPPILTSADGVSAIIKPYDGPDAQNVIQNVNSRHTSNPSRSHNNRANSISVFPNRGMSTSISGNNFRPTNLQNVPPIAEFQTNTVNGDHSPTLPNIPTHPTLNSLITSSLGDAVNNPSHPSQDPAILATSLSPDTNSFVSGPRIGDPGKRMLGAALGVRHPGLAPRMANGHSTGVTVE